MHSANYKTLCITDLDGTLLNKEHRISRDNLAALQKLNDLDVCRIAATGRSLYSTMKVLTSETPFDYVIFSTGAGIIDWHSQEILIARHIDSKLIDNAFIILNNDGIDYMFHAPIPDNHKFVYKSGAGLPDFYSRIRMYSSFAAPYEITKGRPWQTGTQFLIVADGAEPGLHEEYMRKLTPLKVVRTTSPIDHKTLWLEVFSPEVSKGSAVEYLADMLQVKLSDVVVVGNDYNDIEMLELTQHSYITANAPLDMKDKYKVVADYQESGFAEAISDWIKNTDLL